jgi:hypothetical protein
VLLLIAISLTADTGHQTKRLDPARWISGLTGQVIAELHDQYGT